MSRLLLIEDEPALRTGLQLLFSRAGLEVAEAGTAAEGWQKLSQADVIVLDWMLPDEPGTRLLERLRNDERFLNLPVLMLTARASEADRVEGLTRGADDYLAKPFSNAELLARVKALLRRAGKTARMERGGLVFDLERFEVFLDGVSLSLTRREFDVLAFLARRPGKVYSREELLEQVWGAEFVGTPRTVDQHIAQLREKLHENPRQPRFIETYRGVGYRFREVGQRG